MADNASLFLVSSIWVSKGSVMDDKKRICPQIDLPPTVEWIRLGIILRPHVAVRERALYAANQIRNHPRPEIETSEVTARPPGDLLCIPFCGPCMSRRLNPWQRRDHSRRRAPHCRLTSRPLKCGLPENQSVNSYPRCKYREASDTFRINQIPLLIPAVDRSI
jgi:hypothetical protein